MTAIDLYSVNARQQVLDDITACCICTEVYADPKALPCIHTFCMKCLQEIGLETNKGPGDEMPCPICRRMFKIPPEGFHGLPKNLFIAKFIEVANVSDQSASSKASCEACVEENKEETDKEIPVADAYCVECTQRLCEECCRQHGKFRLTKNHQLIPINEHEGGQNVMTNLAPSVCELHERKIRDVYCADCKTVVCAMCFIYDHRNHEGSGVRKIVDDFRNQMKINSEALDECRSKAETKKAELLRVKVDIKNRVENLECDVEKRKDELKQITDKHTTSILQDLCLMRQSKLKEIKMETGDIDTYLSSLETYGSCCQKIMDRGSASDICGAVSNLSVRAVELQEQCQPLLDRNIQSFNLCFRKSELEEFLEENCCNMIGEIQKEGDSMLAKRSKHSLLAEQNDEIEFLRKGVEFERIDKESLRLANEELIININNEVQANKALTEGLSKEKANNDARIKKMEQELDNNRITINKLYANNGKLKLELDEEEIVSNSLQVRNKRLMQEVNTFKTTVRRSEDYVEILQKTIAESRNEIVNLEEKLKQKQMEREQLMITHTEEKRRLQGELRYKSDPVLIQTITIKVSDDTIKKEIRGLTILDNELFVVNALSSEVIVIDMMRFSSSRRLQLKDSIDPMDIASSGRDKCLYIFHCNGLGKSNEISRIDSKGKLIKKWSVGNDCGYGLSVTNESNVILTVFAKNKLNEYSPDGLLIREMKLALGPKWPINYPMHAIKLTNGPFVVCNGWGDGGHHRVSIVDSDGKLKKSFGGIRGSTIKQVNRPFHLSVDANGFVLVTDQLNGRVLLLDSNLQFKREICSKEKTDDFRRPQRIFLDESNDRLIVADNEHDCYGKILIFNFK